MSETRTRPPSVQVTPAHNSQLEQHHAEYLRLKEAADAANAALKACTDAIKAELTAAAPEQGRVDLSSPYGPPLYLTWVSRTTLDSKRIKAERPDLFEAFSVTGGSWQLKPAQGGKS